MGVEDEKNVIKYISHITYDNAQCLFFTGY